MGMSIESRRLDYGSSEGEIEGDSSLKPEDYLAQEANPVNIDEGAMLELVNRGVRAEMAARTANRFLDARRQLFSAFAKDSSLNFKLSAHGNGDTFAFDAKSFTVKMPLSWFENGKYSESELAFVLYHELSHFADMRKNPKAYLASFDYTEKKGEKLAGEYVLSHPDKASKKLRIAKFFEKELNDLYNCLDDIYVNDLVVSRASKYGYGDGRASVVSLYKKTGYENQDLTKLPFHQQLTCALLRDAMVGKELGNSIVSEEVGQVLSKKYLVSYFLFIS